MSNENAADAEGAKATRAANPWFRLYAEFAHDPKVQSMSEAMQRRLLMLLCLRCSNTLVTLQDDELAYALSVTEEALAETKALFLRKKFIDEHWVMLNWNKRQFTSDSSAARVKAHRERKKAEGNASKNGDVTLQKQETNALHGRAAQLQHVTLRRQQHQRRQRLGRQHQLLQQQRYRSQQLGQLQRILGLIDDGLFSRFLS